METFYLVCEALLFGILGIGIGGFCNVILDTFPHDLPLFEDAPRCPKCSHKLQWKDKIPLFSYIFSKGKCRYCGAPIKLRYFAVELWSGLLYLACFTFGSVFVAAVNCLAVSVMLLMAFCDEENLFIPDSFQIALLLLSAPLLLLAPETIWEALIGMAVGGGFYSLFYFGSLVVLKREGMGFGDVKLMTAMGLFLGWKKIIFAIIISSIVSLFRILPKKGEPKEREYPLAPSLVIGGITAMFVGDFLMSLYLSLIA